MVRRVVRTVVAVGGKWSIRSKPAHCPPRNWRSASDGFEQRSCPTPLVASDLRTVSRSKSSRPPERVRRSIDGSSSSASVAARSGGTAGRVRSTARFALRFAVWIRMECSSRAFLFWPAGRPRRRHHRDSRFDSDACSRRGDSESASATWCVAYCRSGWRRRSGDRRGRTPRVTRGSRLDDIGCRRRWISRLVLHGVEISDTPLVRPVDHVPHRACRACHVFCSVPMIDSMCCRAARSARSGWPAATASTIAMCSSRDCCARPGTDVSRSG